MPGTELTAFTWIKEEVIVQGSGSERSKSPRPHSAATSSAGTVYLGITGPKVLSWDSDRSRWKEDSPIELKGNPLLSSCGDTIVCLWIEGKDILICVKPEGGKWGLVKRIVRESEFAEDLAAPQNAPENFVPLAWSTRNRKAIKTMAVPMK